MTRNNVTLHRTNYRRLINRTKVALLTDLELLCHLCLTDSEEAYNEFVRRFYNDVKEECERRCKARKLDKHIGIQVAHETFEKVRRHKTFRESEVKSADSRRGILVYLIRISINLFNDYYRKERKHDELINHKTYFDDLFGVNGIETDPVRLKQIKDIALQIFKRLNKNEQKVVLADVEYKKHQKYLPDDVTERLAVELDIKKDSVRKLRERAIKKIKTAINEFNESE